MPKKQIPIWINTKMALKDIKPWKRNPKFIDKASAKRLLAFWQKIGQFQTIAVGPNGELYDGHQRYDTLIAAFGPDYIVDVRQSSRVLSEAEREELTIAAHVGTTGQFNWEELQTWKIPNLIEWGMDEKYLASIKLSGSGLRGLFKHEETHLDAEPQVDKVEELLAKWKTQPGQLWMIPSSATVGYHQLICGDSRVRAVVDAVLDGEAAVCIWTDPPYGVSYVGRTKDELTINGDQPETVKALLDAAFGIADKVIAEGAPIYIAHPSGPLQMVFNQAFVDAGWKFHETLVWIKDTMVMGHSDYHYQHESMMYGWKGKNRFWYAERDQVSTFPVPRPKRSEQHPTMKPPALIQACLKNSTKTGDIVYEPFCGSGSTIVACENLGRLCRAVDIDPGYCAVTLERLVEIGLKPTLAKSGIWSPHGVEATP